MFADDLTMLSRLKSGLDKVLKTAWEYSQKWRFNFNVTKTVILTFGESQQEHGRELGNWDLRLYLKRSCGQKKTLACK